MRHLAISVLCGALIACTTGNGGGTHSKARITPVMDGQQLMLHLDAEVTLLALSASVRLEGARVVGQPVLDSAAGRSNLFQHNVTESTQLRFVLADSRGLKLARSGTLLRVTVDAAPTRVTLENLSGSDEAGAAVEMEAVEGPATVNP